MSIDHETRAAIAELNAQFAWALDLHDWNALRDLLAEDIHYVSTGREHHFAEDVIEFFTRRRASRTTRHGLGNLTLREGPNGTVLGRGSWHTFASNGQPGNTVPLFMVADFADRYARGDDRHWRITERVITPVFRNDTLAP